MLAFKALFRIFLHLFIYVSQCAGISSMPLQDHSTLCPRGLTGVCYVEVTLALWHCVGSENGKHRYQQEGKRGVKSECLFWFPPAFASQVNCKSPWAG